MRSKVKPSMRGISKSSVITSGRNILTRRNASSPSAALPTISTSELVDRISVMLRRLNTESSTISTRKGGCDWLLICDLRYPNAR